MTPLYKLTLLVLLLVYSVLALSLIPEKEEYNQHASIDNDDHTLIGSNNEKFIINNNESQYDLISDSKLNFTSNLTQRAYHEARPDNHSEEIVGKENVISLTRTLIRLVANHIINVFAKLTNKCDVETAFVEYEENIRLLHIRVWDHSKLWGKCDEIEKYKAVVDKLNSFIKEHENLAGKWCLGSSKEFGFEAVVALGEEQDIYSAAICDTYGSWGL